MSELYLPPTYAKLYNGTEFRETTEAFKRHSRASRMSALKYWSDKRHRRRVDKKQAKAVDVYDLQGHYLRTYPSGRKAAEGLFPDRKRSIAERCIRAARRGYKKSYGGYMYREHSGKPSDIEPLTPPRHKPSGYHVNRKPDTYFTKPCRVTFNDGDTIDFTSLKECAEALHGTYSGIWLAMKQGRKYMKKYIIEIITPDSQMDLFVQKESGETPRLV